MHVYFVGIGGTGLGPLALICKQLGYEVSGSDKVTSTYTEYLKSHGITDINISQDGSAIESIHSQKPIDWLVYSNAVVKENPDHPELNFANEQGIKTTERGALLVQILQEKQLKLFAIAGTHGKTTTTAMAIWLFKQLGLPVSYSVGAKSSFADMGAYEEGSEYFIYECDEYEKNFLKFHPYISVISGLDWDHPDTYPTRESYNQAFQQFIDQSEHTVIWQEDANKLDLSSSDKVTVINKLDYPFMKLVGQVNRENAAIVAQATMQVIGKDEITALGEILNNFPGLSRRFEKIANNIYTDYAHTPEKIKGALQMAHEVLGESRTLGLDARQESQDEQVSRTTSTVNERQTPADAAMRQEQQQLGGSADKQAVATQGPGVVVVYEGLHNTRQHFIKDELAHLFDSAKKLYVVPSFRAREDTSLEDLTPDKLIALTSQPDKAEPAVLNEQLKQKIAEHAEAGDLVLCLSAGGGGSLDEWLRSQFKADHPSRIR